MTARTIHLATRGAIAQLVLDRPDKRNALSAAMWRAIPELVGAAGADPAVKVLILRGVSAEAFSAGADIAEFDRVHASAATAREYHAVVAAAYEALAGLAKPTIAMVQGACFGGGCALALCCDLRYADPSARFCIPPARLGLTYSLGETKRLVDLVGPSRAKEMLMGARVILAEEALRIGLATRLFPAADLERETLAFAEQLSALSQFTIRAVKQVIARDPERRGRRDRGLPAPARRAVRGPRLPRGPPRLPREAPTGFHLALRVLGNRLSEAPAKLRQLGLAARHGREVRHGRPQRNSGRLQR